MEYEARLQKRRDKNKRKSASRNGTNAKSPQQNKMKLNNVEPKTANQDVMFDEFYENDAIIVHGLPGTGKTFLALYLSLLELEEAKEETGFEKILILRSPVSGRDMGFLPGNAKEKMTEYEVPYIKNVNDLYGNDTAYQTLKNRKIIEFMPTSFLRGQTFNNTIVIVDEAQNNLYKDLRTIVTRFGENCKMIIIGDVGQDDITSERYKEKSGLGQLISVMKTMEGVGFVEMGIDDIVRSGFVKNFIIAESKSDIPLHLK